MLNLAQPFAALLVILGFAFAAHRFLKSTFEVSIFLVVSCIICVLYVAALYDGLQMVSTLLTYIGLALFVISIGFWLSQKRRGVSIQFSLTPFFCYVGLIVFLWIRLNTQKFILWDDFSHWGLTTKDLYFTDALPTLDGVVRFLDYPPGGSLFNYFILSIPDAMGWQSQKTFSEGSALIAQGIVLISAAFPIIGYALRKKGLYAGSIIFGTLFLSIFAFGYTPATLMIDLVVAIYFGGAIAVYIIAGRSLSSVVYLFPALICLVLLKSVGLFLSSIVILIIAIDQSRSIYKKYSLNFNKPRDWKGLLISIAVLMCLPLAVMNANLSWNLHVKDLGGQATFKTTITAKDVARVMFGQASEKELKVKENFSKQLLPIVIQYPLGITQINLHNTALAFLMITLLSILILRKQVVKKQFQDLSTLTILFGGFTVYAFGLLLLYFFSFGEYEAIRLASFDRYLGIYLLGWLIALLSIILVFDIYNMKVLVKIFLASLFFGGGSTLYFIKGSKYDVVPKFSNSMERLLDKAKVPRNIQTKIYFISQCDTGFDYVIFRSIVYPAKVPQAPYSLGEPCGSDDIWTVRISKEEWARQLQKDYQYVVIAKASPAFWNQFSMMFDVVKPFEPSIYKVDPHSGKLVYIQNESF